MSVAKPAKKKIEAVAPAAGNIDQIREIIFGTQIRDYERRFADLESRITKAAGDLGKRLEDRVRAIEVAMTARDKALRKELSDSSKKGASGLAQAETKFQKSVDGLQASLAELDEFTETELQALRKDIDAETADLRALLDTADGELRAYAEERVNELDARSVHRKDLAKLLRKMADTLDRA